MWRVAESLKRLREQINAAYPNRDKSSDGSIGDARHASRVSDHNPWVKDRHGIGVVTAIDTDEDLAPNIHSIESIISAIRASRDPRVKYIIYERRITVAGTQLQQWKPYHGVNPHEHHAHISVFSDPKLYDDRRDWAIGTAPVQSSKFKAESEDLLDIPQIQKPREPAAVSSAGENARSSTETVAGTNVPENASISTEQPSAFEESTTPSAEAAATPPSQEGSSNQPIGDPVDAEPRHWFNVEDWKPMVMRWLRRVWTSVSGVSVTQAFGNLVAAFKDPEHWWVYAIIAVVILVLLVGAGLIISLPLLVLWLLNRREISHLKTEQFAALADPNKKNIGLNFVKK